MAPEQALVFLALGIAGLDWLALRNRWVRIDYAAKPSVIIVLLVVVSLAGQDAAEIQFFRLILIGLLASLLGDILLMLPKERFIGGLVAFIAAYIAYIAAFSPTPPPLDLAVLMVFIGFGLAVLFLLRSVLAGINKSGRTRIKVPSIIFGLVIYIMVTTAVLTNLRPAWSAYSAAAIGIGGILIFFSDALLAWNRFVTPLALARLKIRIPYHLGQIAICLGALLLTN